MAIFRPEDSLPMRPLVLFLSLILAACQSNPFRSDLPAGLDEMTKTFEDVVRWGDLNKMVMFLKPDPARPARPQDGLDNVRVTSYETANQLAQIGEYRWGQSVVVHYVLIDRQIVRKLVDHQYWISEDEGQTWYRQNPVPRFD